MLATSITKNHFTDSVAAKRVTAAANPQYHASALNPSAQCGRRPADGVPTPMCTIVFNAAASGIDSSRINATYTGDDSCEGSFTGGAFVMTR